MNKYHRSSIQLIGLIALTLVIAVYVLDMEIGYGIIFLLATVGYTVFLNFKASKKNQQQE